MASNIARTGTIPERDEEKEFIQHQLWKLFGKEGTEQLYLEDDTLKKQTFVRARIAYSDFLAKNTTNA